MAMKKKSLERTVYIVEGRQAWHGVAFNPPLLIRKNERIEIMIKRKYNKKAKGRSEVTHAEK